MQVCAVGGGDFAIWILLKRTRCPVDNSLKKLFLAVRNRFAVGMGDRLAK
jgi:hypothetical protein